MVAQLTIRPQWGHMARSAAARLMCSLRLFPAVARLRGRGCAAAGNSASYQRGGQVPTRA